MRKSIKLGIVATGFTLSALLSACGNSYNDDRGKGDAPHNDEVKPTWDIIAGPDGFMNVATACWKGYRIVITTHAKTDPPPLFFKDENCH